MNEAVLAMPSTSETALVVFAQRGAGHGPFPFYKLLKQLDGITRVIVRDPSERWYNAGLPGLGETPEEVAASIRREICRLGARRVVTLGASMGGYAAILFGCMLGATRAIAFAPQTILDPILPHAPPPEVKLQAPDLKPVVRAASGTEVLLVVGWDNLNDVFQATRLSACDSVRVLAIDSPNHGFIANLHSEGRLRPLLAALIDGEIPRLGEIDPPLTAHVLANIGDAVYAARRGEWERASERMAAVAEHHPEWAAPHVQLGLALAELGDLPGAEAALAAAIRANPGWQGARDALIRVTAKGGRPTKGPVI